MEATASKFEAARRGEAWAQQEILALARRFAQYVCNRVGTAFGADVHWEDVAQEAATRVFTVGLEQYKGPAGRSEDSYVYSIVKTTMTMMARTSDRRRRREEVTEEEKGPRFADIGIQDALDVDSILKLLDDACRQLLRRAFLEDTPYATLAADLEIAESSVRARVSRCIGRARELAR